MSAVENQTIPTNPEWGFWLNFDPGPDDVVHDFCGPSEIAGAVCPNCSTPLLRILSLSAADKRLNVDPAKTPFVHLFYCWTCSIPYGTFSYHIGPNGEVEFLEVPTGYPYAFGSDGPYDGYTGIFPSKNVGLVALSAEKQDALKRAQTDEGLMLELFPQKHLIGGFPVVLNSQKMACPTCLKEPPFFALICDDASGNAPGDVPASQSFTNNLGTQMIFHFCRDCSVVLAYHSND